LSRAVAIMGTSVRRLPNAGLLPALCQQSARVLPVQRPSPCAMALRITLGSASSASVAIGTQRMPSGARLAMPTCHALQRRRLLQRRLVVLSGQPCRARHFGHAAEQAFFRPRSDQEFIAARDDEGGAATQRARLLRRLARKRLLIAACARHAI